MSATVESGGLRARRRDATRLEIHEAAMKLFEHQGFDETTVDEIAAAAGVSSRTFFRYFPTKEDCVLFDRFGFDQALDDHLAAIDPDTFTLADIEAAYRRLLEGFGERGDDVSAHFLRVQKLVLATPTLSRAALGLHSERSTRRPEALSERSSVRTRGHIRMLVDIANLAVQCAFEEWAELHDPKLHDAKLHEAESDNAESHATGPEATTRSLVQVYDEVCRRLREL